MSLFQPEVIWGTIKGWGLDNENFRNRDNYVDDVVSNSYSIVDKVYGDNEDEDDYKDDGMSDKDDTGEREDREEISTNNNDKTTQIKMKADGSGDAGDDNNDNTDVN